MNHPQEAMGDVSIRSGADPREPSGRAAAVPLVASFVSALGAALFDGAPLAAAGSLRVTQAGIGWVEGRGALIGLAVVVLAVMVLLVAMGRHGRRALWALVARSRHRGKLLLGVVVVVGLCGFYGWRAVNDQAVSGASWGAGGAEDGRQFNASAAGRGRGDVPADSEGLDKDAFQHCLDDLMGDGQARSRVDAAKARLQRRGTRPVVAEDVVQDALIATCTRFAGRGLRDKVTLGQWFNGVVNKAAAYEFRRFEGRFCQLDADLREAGSASPEVILDLKAVHAVLCRLDPRDQQIVKLKLQGLSAGDIGAVIGKDEAAARKAVSRALGRLRKALAEG